MLHEKGELGEKIRLILAGKAGVIGARRGAVAGIAGRNIALGNAGIGDF